MFYCIKQMYVGWSEIKKLCTVIQINLSHIKKITKFLFTKSLDQTLVRQIKFPTYSSVYHYMDLTNNIFSPSIPLFITSSMVSGNGTKVHYSCLKKKDHMQSYLRYSFICHIIRFYI